MVICNYNKEKQRGKKTNKKKQWKSEQGKLSLELHGTIAQ